MKLLFLVSLALASTCVPAQSPYQLFRPGVQYLYENPEFADNSYAISTQYYGARVGQAGCDTLYESLLEPVGDPRLCVYRVPSPFGSTICQGADSTVMRFGAMDSLMLYQTAPVGRRWLARDSAGVMTMAEVTAVAFDTVLGLTDTIKTIRFYRADGAEIGVPARLSRQYGLISGPLFYRIAEASAPLEVSGMSSPEVGVQLPAAEDYTRVTVGDIFHIEETRLSRNSLPTGTDFLFAQTLYTAEIVSVDTVDDNYTTFSYRGDVLTYRSTDIAGERGGRDSILVRDTTVQTRVFAPPADLLALQPGARTAEENDRFPRLNLLYALGGCGVLINRLSPEASFTTGDSCGFNTAGVDAETGSAYTARVPFYIDSTGGQSGPVISLLRYRNTAEGECGDPFNLADIIIDVREFDAAFDAQLQVFPNPTGGQLNVVLPGTAFYQVRLYNLTGSQVHSQWMRGGSRQPLATDALPAGSYFLVVFEGARAVGRRKVIVE